MKPIYIGNRQKALIAEEQCHQEAKQRGYSDWWDWYHDERKMKENILTYESYQYCNQVARNYE